MADKLPKSSYDSSQYKRLLYVLVLLVLIVGGYWASIQFMTRDLEDNHRDLSSVMSYHISDPFGDTSSGSRNHSQEFQALSHWPKRMVIDESKVYWFRFSMEEAGFADTAEEYFIALRELGRLWTVASMKLFVGDDDVLKDLGMTGKEVPTEARSYTSGEFILPFRWVDLAENSDLVYVRTTVRKGFSPYFSLWKNPQSLQRVHIRSHWMSYFNFIGLLLILVYIVVALPPGKNRVAGLYFAYLLVWFILLFIHWLAQRGIWPYELEKLMLFLRITGTAFSYFTLFLFTHQWLGLEKRLPRVSRLFPFFTYLNILIWILMIASVLLSHDEVLTILVALRDLLFGTFLLGTGIYAMFSGIDHAWYYNAPFILILGGQMVDQLVWIEILPPWPFPYSEFPASGNVFVLGAILFSLTLAASLREKQRNLEIIKVV
jgi:hypothetical protein